MAGGAKGICASNWFQGLLKPSKLWLNKEENLHHRREVYIRNYTGQEELTHCYFLQRSRIPVDSSLQILPLPGSHRLRGAHPTTLDLQHIVSSASTQAFVAGFLSLTQSCLSKASNMVSATRILTIMYV